MGQSLRSILFGNDLDCAQQPDNHKMLLLNGFF